MTPLIPVSTVPSVRAYLAQVISEQIAGDSKPILLTVGDPGPDEAPDIIKIGEVRRTADQLAIVGSGEEFFLEEKYDLSLLSSSYTGSGSDDWDYTQQLAVEARAWQLNAYVETACRLDPSLGDLVVVSAPSQSVSDGPEWTESPVGLLCEVGLVLHVEATL